MTEQAVGGTSSRGVVSTPSEVYSFLEHCVKLNLTFAEAGQLGNKVVPCVWGPAGVSKTSLYKQMEQKGLTLADGKVVYPKVIHVALAQIEEAGDLTGLPLIGKDEDGNTITDYAAPRWWPTEEDATDADGNERPVILLIDDFNRADPRILKAIMQLLQDYGTNTRSLPPSTTIGLTGNPPTGDDGTEYMVNEIDKAILTRMLHISMRFDKECWAAWAQANNVDSRVVNFVLRYPELVDGTKGERTNPRSVVDFAHLISGLKDLKRDAAMLTVLARSCLDDEVATTFEKFVVGDLQDIVEPETILNDWKAAKAKFEQLKKRHSKEGGKLRTDIMGIILDRLYIYLMQPSLAGKLDKQHYQGFLEFIKSKDLIPEDAVYTLLRRLRRDAKTKEQQTMFADMIRHGGKEIADIIMSIS